MYVATSCKLLHSTSSTQQLLHTVLLTGCLSNVKKHFSVKIFSWPIGFYENLTRNYLTKFIWQLNHIFKGCMGNTQVLFSYSLPKAMALASAEN